MGSIAYAHMHTIYYLDGVGFCCRSAAVAWMMTITAYRLLVESTCEIIDLSITTFFPKHSRAVLGGSRRYRCRHLARMTQAGVSRLGMAKDNVAKK